LTYRDLREDQPDILRLFPWERAKEVVEERKPYSFIETFERFQTSHSELIKSVLAERIEESLGEPQARFSLRFALRGHARRFR